MRMLCIAKFTHRHTHISILLQIYIVIFPHLTLIINYQVSLYFRKISKNISIVVVILATLIIFRIK